MGKHLVIGVNGQAQSGKDTLCSMLSYLWDDLGSFDFWFKQLKNNEFNIKRLYNNMHPLWSKTYYFAEPVKQQIAIFLGIEDITIFEDEDFKNSDTIYQKPFHEGCYTVREFMNFYGTNLCRHNINQNVWVDVLKNKLNSNIQNYKTPDKDICLHFITDVRFSNEYEMLKHFDTQFIVINNDNHSVVNHESAEYTVTNPNYYIDNTFDPLLHKNKNSVLFKDALNKLWDEAVIIEKSLLME